MNSGDVFNGDIYPRFPRSRARSHMLIHISNIFPVGKMTLVAAPSEWATRSHVLTLRF